MLTVTTLSIFFLTSLLLALSPGPDNVFVLTQSMTKGWRAGLAVTAGLCTGLLFHTAAVAFGVAASFQNSEIAFTTLKICGALYLLHLAFQSFRASPENHSLSHDELSENKNNLIKRSELASLYRRGIIMNVTNPKVSIFFLAFLPQFTDSAKGSVVIQMVILGTVFLVAAAMVFSMISFVAGKLAAKFRRSEQIQKQMNKVAGIVFAGLATKLAFQTR